MIRTDQENKEWWTRLTLGEKNEMFDYLVSKSPKAESFLRSLEAQYKQKGTLSDKQIAALRKFEEQS